MKNSKFNKEINERLNDPSWEKRMVMRVLEEESDSLKAANAENRQVNSIYLKLVAAVFLLAAGIGFWFYGGNSSRTPELAANQKNLLSSYDIESGDLLWEDEEDYDNNLLGVLEE
ncbi:hypothetical protein LPTSP3_g28170 [Leptospira kobayashii]|uniref:Uncharacterized protein n=1 Tax=Leptospira kobayashii TaxID=1917830 RepID=A0ABN6KKP8_9LEPT|nr:hypothetical protein [Leptospira kobayashii]BDA79887.1 hypothetical protein LPTSP3_g28170 [Leptospira kobayashii]